MGILQVVLTAVLFASLSQWKEKRREEEGENAFQKKRSLSPKQLLDIPGVKAQKMCIRDSCYAMQPLIQ